MDHELLIPHMMVVLTKMIAIMIALGERASLIIWTKSSRFRQTAAYLRRWGPSAPVPRDKQTPDRICLSSTYE
jgi:hypothetical protein